MSDDEQPRWLWLEEWLIDHEGEQFRVYDLAERMRISPTTATLLIQSYLIAQRRKNSQTVYTLKRTGRTRAAIWSFGLRKPDAEQLDMTLYEDVVVKVRGAWAPDAKRLADLNPKLAKRYERKVEAVMSGALVVLRNALDDGLSE